MKKFFILNLFLLSFFISFAQDSAKIKLPDNSIAVISGDNVKYYKVGESIEVMRTYVGPGPKSKWSVNTSPTLSGGKNYY